MDTTTAVVCLAAIAAAVYLSRLFVRERGDFEAGGGAGLYQFFVKVKERRK